MRGLIGLCFLLLNFVIVPLSAAQSAESDEAEANPGRPTVSTPATLTPVGYLQFESGVLGASHSPEFSSRYGFNEVTKLSVTPRLEFIASAEPLVHYRADGTSANGTAEVFLGAQAMVSHGEGSKPTIAASYFRRVYDGGVPEVDFGSPRNSFLLLASADVKDFTTMQMPSSMSKPKRRCIGLSSVRRFPFHIMLSGNSGYRVKSGTSRSRSFVAMLLE